MTEPVPPAPAALRPNEQDVVVRERLAVPERPLRLLLKKVTQVVSANGEAEIGQAIASFRLELEAYILQLERLEAVATKTTVAEVQAYREMVHSMDQEKVGTLEAIQELKKELVYVQQDRKNKLEYDQLASEIMKYGTREELETQLASLRTTIDSLSGESSKYTDIMIQSKSRFEGIAKELKQLRADVGFEVGERERREVEREGEGDAEEEARSGEEAVEAAAAATAEVHADRVQDEQGEDGDRHGKGRKSTTLSASAPVFKPRGSRDSSPGVGSVKGAATKRRRSARRAGEEEEDEEDEELAKKRAREEGEMSEEEEEGAA